MDKIVEFWVLKNKLENTHRINSKTSNIICSQKIETSFAEHTIMRHNFLHFKKCLGLRLSSWSQFRFHSNHLCRFVEMKPQ